MRAAVGKGRRADFAKPAHSTLRGARGAKAFTVLPQASESMSLMAGIVGITGWGEAALLNFHESNYLIIP